MNNSNSNNFKIVLIPSIMPPIERPEQNRRIIKVNFDDIFNNFTNK